MNEPLKTIQVRNGSVLPVVAVSAIHLSLESLLQRQPIAFYELVTACRQPAHQLWPGVEEHLDGLIEGVNDDGTPRIHAAVRDVVLSSVHGDDAAMTLGAPA